MICWPAIASVFELAFPIAYLFTFSLACQVYQRLVSPTDDSPCRGSRARGGTGSCSKNVLR